MRRAIPGVAALIACLVATAVCACTPVGAAAGGPPPSTSGIGPITFATGQLDSSWLRNLIAAWNSAHPGQKVTLLLLPGTSNDQLAQLVTNLQAKSDVYDVMDMDVIWTAQFASAGWIVPLDARKFPLAQFLKPAVDTAMYDGRLFAVPYYSNADLLYYRKDILAKAGDQPPRTWSQLRELAETVAPKYGLGGYASQFAPYEGLTVNFADAVYSAGGSILSPDGTKVTVDSPQALAALDFLVSGFRAGWIPKATLSYEESSSGAAFEAGRYLFLNNWPYVYGEASTPGKGNEVYGKFGVTALPGPDGPGASTLGGGNLAISAYSRHQQTALDFIEYFTQLSNERAMLEDASFPPVWKQLYTSKALIARYPYLPTLEKAILSARPRPAITDYDQASLAISSEVYQAITFQQSARQALANMSAQLDQIIGDG
jgi:multiple sugar transport system substrate-binding protein